MILFGYRTKPKDLGSFKRSCEQCKKNTFHKLVKVTQWFTLYFLPVIPLSNKVYMGCNVCGAGYELKGELKAKVLEGVK